MTKQLILKEKTHSTLFIINRGEFNLPQENNYILYNGKITSKMSELICSGQRPISVAELMKKKLEIYHSQADERIKNSWFTDIFSTGDAVVYPSKDNKKFKIELDSINTQNINQASKLSKGALIIPSYENSKGKEFKSKDDLSSRLMTREQAKENSIHQYLVREDKHLLSEYVDLVFNIENITRGYGKNMAFFTIDAQEAPTLRLIHADFLGGTKSSMFAIGNLDSDDSALLGVSHKSLESKL